MGVTTCWKIIRSLWLRNKSDVLKRSEVAAAPYLPEDAVHGCIWLSAVLHPPAFTRVSCNCSWAHTEQWGGGGVVDCLWSVVTDVFLRQAFHLMIPLFHWKRHCGRQRRYSTTLFQGKYWGLMSAFLSSATVFPSRLWTPTTFFFPVMEFPSKVHWIDLHSAALTGQ